MGGEKETKVSAKKSTKSGSVEIGELRIHENKGEIHFHDDAKSLKCAVPVATWFATWQRMWNEINTEFNLVDTKNGTTLLAKVVCIIPERPVSQQNSKPILDLHIYVDETEPTDALKAMLKFMEE